MKMILAVIKGDDVKNVTKQLLTEGFQFTTLASTGGFLRTKSTTLLCGMRNERVPAALDILKRFASSKKGSPPGLSTGALGYVATDIPAEFTFGGATVFVMDIEKFVKF